MVKGNAQIASSNHQKPVSVGGVISDLTPLESGTIAGFSYVGSFGRTCAYPDSGIICIRAQDSIHFDSGVTTTEPSPVDWSQLEYLATTLQPVYDGNGQVHIVCKGGAYSFSDFSCRRGGGTECPYNTNAPGGRNFLIVFNTEDDVYITGDQDARQFFASILAPFSAVTVSGDAGFIDGFVVAKSYREVGSGDVSTQVAQVRGNCWNRPDGIMACGARRNCNSYLEVVTSGTDNSCNTKFDRFPKRKCDKKRQKHQCAKKRVAKKCMYTCSSCGD